MTPAHDTRAPEGAGPRQARATRGHIVLDRAAIKSYAVLADAISIKVFVRATPERTAGLLRRVAEITRGGARVPVAIDGFRTLASVEAISSTTAGTRLLLHAPKDPVVGQTLFDVVGRDAVRVTVGVPEELAHSAGEAIAEEDLADLLARAAARRGVPVPDLLERLTTFRGRDGRLVSGRRALAELSDAQRPVVADRLRRMLEKASTTPEHG